MGFQEAVKKCLSNYVTFSGRAPRSEYWFFILFVLVVGLILSAIDSMLFGVDEMGQPNGLLGVVFALAMFLPIISAAVRRLHDRDMSGWWYLLVLIPIIGGLVLLFFFVQKGTDGSNRFGPDPLA